MSPSIYFWPCLMLDPISQPEGMVTRVVRFSTAPPLVSELFDREWNSRSLISLYSVDVFDVSAQTFWSYQTFSNFSPDHPNSTNSLITNSQRMLQAKHFGQTKHFLLILPMPPILFLPILLLLILLLPILAHLPILKFSNIPILQF